MIRYTIKTHTLGMTYKKPHIFALNRGYNTGKPLSEECPNCFVILCDTENDTRRMRFLLEALWRTQVFRYQLIGSVIPYLRVHEFSKTIRFYWKHIHHNEARILRLEEMLRAMEIIQNQFDKFSTFLTEYRYMLYKNIIKVDAKNLEEG
jgi:hypothetical protein